MLGWVITLLILALIAGLLGFGGMAATFSGIAQILFYIFIVLFVLSLVRYLVTGRKPRSPL